MEQESQRRFIFASLPGVLFLWAIAEASVWFVAPDFLIILFCLAPRPSLKKFVLIGLLGSLVGGVLYATLCSLYPAQTWSILQATPFASSWSIAHVAGIYDRFGVLGVGFQSFTLIPFKIWTNLAVQRHFSLVPYFLIVLLSRAVRFTVSGFIAQWFATRYRTVLDRHFGLTVFLISLAFFAWLMVWER